MAQAVYTYELRDLRTNLLLATVPLLDVQFSKVLNDTSSLQGTLPLPLFNSLGQRREVFELTTPAHTCVYAYRDNTPVWGGIIWTTDYDSEANAITIGAADWWSYLDHRKILPVLTGAAFSITDHIGQLAVGYTAQYSAIARQLLALAQAHTGGDLGIVATTGDYGSTHERTYPGYSMTPLGDQLRNLTENLNGPDLRFDVGPVDEQGRPTRRMLIGTPDLGAVDDHVWEWGGNLLRYKWPRDATKMRSRSFAIGEGSDRATPIGAYEEPGLYALGWPLLEDDTGYDRTTGSATLIDNAQADQQVLRLPVVLPTFVVNGAAYPTITEVSPGDRGRLLIRDDYHGYQPGLDTTARVVQLEVTPESETGEEIAITAEPQVES
ncbi:hypothetical protein [Saccharothrix lopnurensis]|uniref:Uncharacterized protein n=1 Tax=Saccharothrix lopnurensis TaxID=1670621 RepID=A0ABW1PI32_9PSEU